MLLLKNQKKAKSLLKVLENIKYGSIELISPEGKTYLFESPQKYPHSQLQLYDWHVVTHFARKGSIGFAEDYREGRWETNDLATLLEIGLHNQEHLYHSFFGNSTWHLFFRLFYLLRRNTLRQSRYNISAHYDLSNEFFAQWLDPSMTYSSALFHNTDDSLMQGQFNKYDRILERLGHTPKKILEIGCGWGGFMERAVEKWDHSVTGITISESQYDYTKARLQDKNQARVSLKDYRNQHETFDAIVSIEMLEAVGEIFWSNYFNQLAHLLKRRGKAMIQTITIRESDFDRYRTSSDFIRSFIFPGGLLLTQTRLEKEANKAGLKITDLHSFGQDYKRTLNHWLRNFDNRYSAIRALGFDEAFIRMWRFYLASCMAAFSVNKINVIQVEMQHV